jgi:hypothetical protein
MGEDNLDAIAMIEAKSAVLALGPEATIEDKLRAAMKVTRNHWLLEQMRPSEGRDLRAAVGGVLMALGPDHPDYERLGAEHRTLARLSQALEAAQRGIHVDIAAMAEQEDVANKPEPIGILRLWKEG